MIIGVISDTHGVLNSNLLNALQGVEKIIHAGDIGGLEVIEALRHIAPVTAVRGNMDIGPWAHTLAPTEMIEFNGSVFYVLHNLYDLDLVPSAAGVQIVISGHTHQPEIKKDRGVLYFNPGSASLGHRGGPPSMGRIEVSAEVLHPEIIYL